MATAGWELILSIALFYSGIFAWTRWPRARRS